MEYTKSCLKWAGGKSKLLPTILPLLKGNRLIEPFMGSGVVFLNSEQTDVLVNDFNSDLINVFQQIQKHPTRLINELKPLFLVGNTEEDYIKYRAEFNSLTNQTLRKAALFIYLNRHCFNGLCRYNASNNFNVPYGRYDKPYLPEQEIKIITDKLKNINIQYSVGDFTNVMLSAIPGDVIYCDPPYVPLSDTASFTAYAATGFTIDQQNQLASLAETLQKKGIKVIISNHDTDFTREIYKNASDIKTIDVHRSISANGSNRKKVQELIAIYE